MARPNLVSYGLIIIWKNVRFDIGKMYSYHTKELVLKLSINGQKQEISVDINILYLGLFAQSCIKHSNIQQMSAEYCLVYWSLRANL